MINLYLTHDYQRLTEILKSDKLLAESSGFDNSHIDSSFTYLLIKQHNKIIGFFQFRAFTNILTEAHISVISEYWGKGLGPQLLDIFFSWLRKNTNFKQVMANVPISCIHIHKLMNKVGANVNGLIKNGCIYKNMLTDLIIYSYNLYGESNE